jgi:hypothetical protein
MSQGFWVGQAGQRVGHVPGTRRDMSQEQGGTSHGTCPRDKVGQNAGHVPGTAGDAGRDTTGVARRARRSRQHGQVARFVLGSIPFVTAAPVVSWAFSEPDRMFSGIGWAAGSLLQTTPGTVLACVAAGAVAWRYRDLLVTKACGACGYGGKLLPEHEGGHVAGAEAAGLKVTGASVVEPDRSGFTRIPNWAKDPWIMMVVAACGPAGERFGGANEGRCGGSRSEKGSDLWWIHRLAPKVAKVRGITAEEAIRLADAEATRLVSSNSGRWREARDILRRDGKFGDVD